MLPKTLSYTLIVCTQPGFNHNKTKQFVEMKKIKKFNKKITEFFFYLNIYDSHVEIRAIETLQTAHSRGSNTWEYGIYQLLRTNAECQYSNETYCYRDPLGSTRDVHGIPTCFLDYSNPDISGKLTVYS